MDRSMIPKPYILSNKQVVDIVFETPEMICSWEQLSIPPTTGIWDVPSNAGVRRPAERIFWCVAAVSIKMQAIQQEENNDELKQDDNNNEKETYRMDGSTTDFGHQLSLQLSDF